MSTDTPKTTEQWVLAHLNKSDNRYYPSTRSASATVLVRSNNARATLLTDAARDPANVLNVEAYPGVVEALKPLVEAVLQSPQGAEVNLRTCQHEVNLDYHVQMTITVGEARAIIAALASAQGNKP